MTMRQQGRRGRPISPVDTGRKLNVHKTSRTSSERLIYVQFTLRPVSTGLAMCVRSMIYGYACTLSIGSTFCVPEKGNKIWADLVNILYVAPVPAETKRGKKLENFVLENVMQKFPVWKNKN